MPELVRDVNVGFGPSQLGAGDAKPNGAL